MNFAHLLHTSFINPSFTDMPDWPCQV